MKYFENFLKNIIILITNPNITRFLFFIFFASIGTNAIATIIESAFSAFAIDAIFTFPIITSDNYHGGVLATNLLLNNGCKKSAHISGPLEINTPGNKRYQAFIDITKENNIEAVVIEGKLDTFEGYKKIGFKLFQEHPDIDGIFSNSDIIAA